MNQDTSNNKPGPYKEKADDYLKLTSSELLEKYPNDPDIYNAIAARENAKVYASKILTDKKAITGLVAQAEKKAAEKIEHGTPIPCIVPKKDQDIDR